MKVIQIPFCFYPDPIGGTEVYVEALSKHLKDKGIQVLIAAPWKQEASYVHGDLQVRRFAITQALTNLRDLYGDGDALAASSFSSILDSEKPDIVHMHAFTPAISLRLLHQIKRRKIPIVFTYHTPTVSCQRGTLMRWGREVCDGKIRLDVCTRCALHGYGMPRVLGDIVGQTPVALGRFLGKAHLSGGVWTVLRMRELIDLRGTAFRNLMAEVDHVVAVSEWVRNVLLINDVPQEKITLSRQGLYEKTLPLEYKIENQSPELKIAFLGRMDPTKGAHVLIQAIRLAPHLNVILNIYGVVQGETSNLYFKNLQKLAAGDKRIVFHEPIPSNQVVQRLKAFDILAVPSQWLESGPLVVLEAFAAGIPVVGSNLGGVAELVEHEVNGLLVASSSVEAWQQVLQRLSTNKNLLLQLRSGIRPPRTMATVADEMFTLYDKILREKMTEI